MDVAAFLLIIKMVGLEPTRDVRRVELPDMALCQLYADLINHQEEHTEMAICVKARRRP